MRKKGNHIKKLRKMSVIYACTLDLFLSRRLMCVFHRAIIRQQRMKESTGQILEDWRYRDSVNLTPLLWIDEEDERDDEMSELIARTTTFEGQNVEAKIASFGSVSIRLGTRSTELSRLRFDWIRPIRASSGLARFGTVKAEDSWIFLIDRRLKFHGRYVHTKPPKWEDSWVIIANHRLKQSSSSSRNNYDVRMYIFLFLV